MKKERINKLYSNVMYFTIGCFLGCIFETLLCFAQRGYFESRSGLIYGPFNPVYGFGVMFLVMLLRKYKKDYAIFFFGALYGGIIEYISSWIQEFLFHSTSWNYSHYFLNFDGRTSIYHMMWWGLLSLLFMKHIDKHIENLIFKIKKHRLLIAILIIIFFVINAFISGYASLRQYERSQNIEATTSIQRFFDKHYPDSLVNKVYPNRMISTKSNIQNQHKNKSNKGKQSH